MKKLIVSTVAALAVIGGGSLAATGTASADPGGWVGPFHSDWTCGQKMSSMGLKVKPCTYGKTSRGVGYYFFYRP